MNKEIIKAMNKRSTKWDAIRKWWSFNGYKVLRVILFPIWFAVVSIDKFKNYRYIHLEWSNEKADEILNYFIPRVAYWNNNKKHFHFFDNGLGWTSPRRIRKNVKFKDRRFWKKYTNWCGGEIREYLITHFQLDGFTKEILNCSDLNTEINFTLIENEKKEE